MVGGLKIVQVKTGQEAEFERLFVELRSEMRAIIEKIDVEYFDGVIE